MTDRLEHDIKTDTYIVTLDQSDDDGPVSFFFSEYELRRTFLVIMAHYCQHDPVNTVSLRGLVTGTEKDTDIERPIEWVGAPSSAQYRARKLVESGKLKGAKAWLNIGNYGCYINEWPGIQEDEELEPEESQPDPEEDKAQTKMDRWFT